jgi:putative transposase
VARCTVARLMARLGLRGAVRGRAFKTTVADTALARPEDRVKRNFAVERPDALWVSDLTYGTPSQRRPPVWGWSCLSMSGMHDSTKSMLQ